MRSLTRSHQANCGHIQRNYQNILYECDFSPDSIFTHEWYSFPNDQQFPYLIPLQSRNDPNPPPTTSTTQFPPQIFGSATFFQALLSRQQKLPNFLLHRASFLRSEFVVQLNSCELQKKRVDKQTAIKKKKIKKNSPTFWRSPISIIEIINFVAVEIWQTHLIFVQLSSMKLARYWHRVHIYFDIRKNRMNLTIVPCFAIQRAPITLQMKWKHGLNKVFMRILWPNVRHFKCNFVYSSNSFEHLPLLTDFWHYFGVFFFVPNCVRWFLAALFDSTNREKAIACEQMSEWTNAKDALNGFLACTRKKFYFYNDCDTFEKRNEQICVYLKKNVIQIRHL